MALSVEVLREHLNDVPDADSVLDRILAAAIAHTERQLGFEIDDATEFPDGTPADVEQAVLMLGAHWYENREASVIGVSAQSVPFGYREIVAEHRKYTFAAVDDE